VEESVELAPVTAAQESARAGALRRRAPGGVLSGRDVALAAENYAAGTLDLDGGGASGGVPLRWRRAALASWCRGVTAPDINARLTDADEARGASARANAALKAVLDDATTAMSSKCRLADRVGDARPGRTRVGLGS